MDYNIKNILFIVSGWILINARAEMPNNTSTLSIQIITNSKVNK